MERCPPLKSCTNTQTFRMFAGHIKSLVFSSNLVNAWQIEDIAILIFPFSLSYKSTEYQLFPACGYKISKLKIGCSWVYSISPHLHIVLQVWWRWHSCCESPPQPVPCFLWPFGRSRQWLVLLSCPVYCPNNPAEYSLYCKNIQDRNTVQWVLCKKRLYPTKNWTLIDN